MARASASLAGPEQRSVVRRAARRRAEHFFQPLGRLERADQDRDTLVRLPAHHIQAVVHAIGEVDVSVAARQVHRLATGSAAATPGVGCPVLATQVGLHLDDQAGPAPPVDDAHQPLAEEPARGGDGIGAEAREALSHRAQSRGGTLARLSSNS